MGPETEPRYRPALLGHIAWANVVHMMLLHAPCSYEDLAEHSGLHKLTIGRFMRALRTRGAVHIAGWALDDCGRHSRSLWAFGDLPDTERPPRQTRKEIRDRHRRNQQRINAKNLLGALISPTPTQENAPWPD